MTGDAGRAQRKRGVTGTTMPDQSGPLPGLRCPLPPALQKQQQQQPAREDDCVRWSTGLRSRRMTQGKEKRTAISHDILVWGSSPAYADVVGAVDVESAAVLFRESRARWIPVRSDEGPLTREDRVGLALHGGMGTVAE